MKGEGLVYVLVFCPLSRHISANRHGFRERGKPVEAVRVGSLSETASHLLFMINTMWSPQMLVQAGSLLPAVPEC